MVNSWPTALEPRLPVQWIHKPEKAISLQLLPAAFIRSLATPDGPGALPNFISCSSVLAP